MTDVSDYGGSVAIDDPSGSGETSPDELKAVARENVSRIERNRRRAERRADVDDLAVVSDDEPLIEILSRSNSPAPSPPKTPSLATHPALQNFDVICTICSYAHYGSLPALASTCRVFERPALDVLWRNLQSVEPLVKCLPDDLFGVGYMALLKPLDAKMWDILRKYTSRVYSITHSGRSTVIEPLGLLMLSCPSAPASLFPNLRELTWHADGTHCAAEFLRMAFVPTLVFLDVQISSASSIFLSVLSSLGTLCPHLRRMTVQSPSPSATNDLLLKNSPFIAQSISQLHHLQELSVWDLGNQGIEHLMQLRTLQILCLDLKVSSAWDRRSHLQLPGFHDLNCLTLSIDNLDHASDFVSSLQVVRSRSITICFTVAHLSRASTTMSQFFAILKETCDRDNLESLTLLESSRSKGHAASSVLTPLHAFRNLTQLLIENGCTMSMDDEQLRQLARVWPKLEVLAISRFVVIDNIIIPTFRGLIGLVQLCPGLTSLTLVIDTTGLPDIGMAYISPGGGICNKHLKNLVLSNSPIESPMRVALVLSGLFPNLMRVDLDCWDSAPTIKSALKQSLMKQWEDVNLNLVGFVIVRARDKEAPSGARASGLSPGQCQTLEMMMGTPT
ncbi:uncharacterized protein EDB91DRAFT_1347153 [Suillus paluster]|uniref:uncharacterized protein n=1 Tax=Suillus paluster TaxID=48578 RepID=UPI001B86D051|nr:uncharacterized protein EDB91DRAFT_1347153 [Suillus paluster]KAG1740201.1 hypothetical protein EDB91DRAFT_1347153 [Suillus paluster]